MDHRRLAAVCLAGIAVTSALDSEAYTDEPESPAEDPVPRETYVVDCADELEERGLITR